MRPPAKRVGGESSLVGSNPTPSASALSVYSAADPSPKKSRNACPTITRMITRVVFPMPTARRNRQKFIRTAPAFGASRAAALRLACHSERSEESHTSRQTLRSAQGYILGSAVSWCWFIYWLHLPVCYTTVGHRWRDRIVA